VDPAPRSIFRLEALHHYAQRQARARAPLATPRLLSRRSVICLWALLGALAVVGAASCFLPVAAVVSGPAVVPAPRDGSAPGTERIAAALLPAGLGSRLQVGQSVSLRLEPSGAEVRSTVLAIDPETITPSEAQRRFALDPWSAGALGASSLVVLVGLDPQSAGTTVLPAGTVGLIEVEVGSRRAGSYLPLIDRLVGE
jgi:hypothetical protein